jgi:hypothetical protein
LRNAIMIHPCDLTDQELLRQCTVRRQRRSGPGGQHRNKVETAIFLVHQPSGIGAEASERRSQHENHRVALRRLRLGLALRVRADRPPSSVPSLLWSARCQNQRISANVRHEDFAALLAEALDVVTACRYELSPAAAALHVTSSQLTRFLKLEPQALRLVNQQRQQLGLHDLR